MTKSLKEKQRLSVIKDIRDSNHSFNDKKAYRFKYGHSISSYLDQVDSSREIKIFKPIYKKLFAFVRGNITHKNNRKLRDYIENILISTHSHLNIFDFKIVLHFLPAFVNHQEISFYLVASIYDHKRNSYIGEINFNNTIFETNDMIVFNRETKKIFYESFHYFNEKLNHVPDEQQSILIQFGKNNKKLKHFEKLLDISNNYLSEIEKLKENPDFEAYSDNISSYSIKFKVNKDIYHNFAAHKTLIFLSFMSNSPMGQKMANFLKRNNKRRRMVGKGYQTIENINYKESILEEFIYQGFFEQSLIDAHREEKISFENMMAINAIHIY